MNIGREKTASKREKAKKKRRVVDVMLIIIRIIRITFIFILCSLFIDYFRKVNTFEKKEEKEESESECVRI